MRDTGSGERYRTQALDVVSIEFRIIFINQLKGPYRANTRNIYKQNNTNNNTHS